MARRRFLVLGVGALLVGGARPLVAQQGEATQRGASGDECELRPGPRGLIRGDRVPSGCVLVVQHAEKPEAPIAASSVVLVPAFFVSRVVLLDKPLTDFPRAPAGTDAAASDDNLPRARTDQPFGPITRPFGPVLQPFRPVNRHFGRVAQPFRPTNTHFRTRAAGEPPKSGS
ncbi:MAG: hypothetical protein HY702_00410 [Gemmatimonadetes bacterium]|nr:hypothetical protein [Gemmatimonadota bacterium]